MERFDEFIERCLYDPVQGFYSSRGHAGGAQGDFITSPEVGPLFGAVLARAVDTWWGEIGRPDEFTLIEAGAGRGTLARSLLAAAPECRRALRLVTVEQSARLREAQAELLLDDGVAPTGGSDDPIAGVATSGGELVPVEIRSDLPRGPITGVVLANELLDNLAFRMVQQQSGRWHEVEVDVPLDGSPPRGLAGPEAELAPSVAAVLPAANDGTRLPVCDRAKAWVERALGLVERGRVVVIDYGVRSTGELLDREWLRTYRAHVRADDPFAAAGSVDITCDVPFDQLPDGASIVTQREFLRQWGIGGLVEEGRSIWHERAQLGDLAAIRARSRIAESEALLDPAGLGGFLVAQWER